MHGFDKITKWHMPTGRLLCVVCVHPLTQRYRDDRKQKRTDKSSRAVNKKNYNSFDKAITL